MDARFGLEKYRYTLSVGGLALSKAMYISAIHKCDRRDLSSFRVFLVRAFFNAVSKETDISSALAGAITNQMKRFAIAVFEEGSFLHLDSILQRIIVECFVCAQQARSKREWSKCAAYQIKIIRVTDGVYRGRLGSVIARHILDGRSYADSEAPLAHAMTNELIWRSHASKDAARSAVTHHLPVLLPLFSNEGGTNRKNISVK